MADDAGYSAALAELLRDAVDLLVHDARTRGLLHRTLDVATSFTARTIIPPPQPDDEHDPR